MGWNIQKALHALLIPQLNQGIARRVRRAGGTRKTPVFALAARLFVAGAFVIGQPVVADPTPDIPVRSGGDAFGALQDFVQTQRVVSLNFMQPPGSEPNSHSRDPYSVLSDFVRVADASGWIPLPVQAVGAPPDDAIHAGLRAGASGGDASSASPDFVKSVDNSGMAAAPAQGAAPNDAVHAGLRAAASNGGDDYSALTAFAKSVDDSGAPAAPAQGAAPDDAIHAGLHAAATSRPGYSPSAGFATTAVGTGSAAPDDAIHAGLKSAADTGSDDYSALRDFATGLHEEKPMVLAAAASETPKAKQPAAATSGPAAYVGSQACVKCHRDQFGSFSQTLHGEIFLKHPRDAQEKEGCESCHGPGSKHVQTKEADSGAEGDIISFSKDAPRPVAERNAICLTCHERGDRTYWDGSTHDTRGLACTSCHQIMEKVSVKFQLIKARNRRSCFQCHKDIRAKMVNSSHMPLDERLDGLLILPQPARQRDGRAPARGFGQRDLLQVPRGQARPVPVGTRAGARQLPQLPQPARIRERVHADDAASSSLPVLPHGAWPRKSRQPDDRAGRQPVMPELPHVGARFEFAGRRVVPEMSSSVSPDLSVK